MPLATPEQIAAYKAAPSQLAATIAGLNQAQMQHILAEGEWSIHEVVIHLADAEVMGFWRLRKTLAETGTILPVYDEEAWSSNLSYNTQQRHLAIALFSALRASTAALLRTLPAEAWARTSVHPERGEMSVYDLFNLYLEHGTIHLQQIERIKQSLPTTLA